MIRSTGPSCPRHRLASLWQRQLAIGPGRSTLNHVTPWVTTVGASTVAPYAGTVVLGNGKKYAGISTTVFGNVGPARLVTARSVKRASAAGDDADVCAPDTLSRAKAAGKIVVCDRGVVTRVDKSAEVKRAGGKGMVLANLTESSTDADTHAVPTVHLDVPFGSGRQVLCQEGRERPRRSSQGILPHTDQVSPGGELLLPWAIGRQRR